MSLVDTIRKDMFESSKDGSVEKTDILKMALASLKNAELASEKELTEADMEKVLRKEVKKIQDSIEQFTQMGRTDLLKKEEIQLEVLNQYLPELLSEDEVRKVVEEKIAQLGATSMREMGMVMGTVMKELDGKTDGNTVKTIVQELLS